MPNERGPNELRLVEATKRGSSWRCNIIPDELTTKKYLDPLDITVTQAKRRAKAGDPVYGSEYAAKRILNRVNPTDGSTGRDLLFFVHGYNSDMRAVLERAHSLEKRYGVEMLVFAWPSLGGGGPRGTLSYLDDKQRAQVSAPALNRVLEKFHGYLTAQRFAEREKIVARAIATCDGDREREGAFIAKHFDADCGYRLTMLCHSMGNYVLENSLKMSLTATGPLIFDNIVLAAADANNHEHAWWVDKLQVRQRLYITINEDDGPLRASRIKPGSQQLARLGAYVKNLDSSNGYYVDFTDAPEIGGTHTYFDDEPVENNSVVGAFFDKAMHGRRAEGPIPYDAATNTYRVRDA
ncbi:MAG: alpha/beta hydrolase [Planctomycetota bacterium]